MMAVAGLIHLNARKSGTCNFDDLLVGREREPVAVRGGAGATDRLPIRSRDVELVTGSDVAQVIPASVDVVGGMERSPGCQAAQSKRAKYMFHGETRVRLERGVRGLGCGTFR